jgi:TrmH family RNA methyltransferase
MLSNKQIKLINSLHSKKGRKENDLFLVEGEKSLLELVKSDFSVEFFVLAENQTDLLHELSLKSPAYIYAVSEEQLTKLSTLVTNQVGLAVVKQKQFNQFKINSPYTIVLDGIRDPGNLGTIIRSAVATGVDGIWTSEDSVEFDNPKVLRASAGAWFHLPKQSSPDLGKLIQDYQTQGIQVIATQMNAPKTYWETDFTRSTIILLGNEGAGLSPDLAKLADETVRIPLASGVESLNVAIAAALLLYEAQRQKAILQTFII